MRRSIVRRKLPIYTLPTLAGTAFQTNIRQEQLKAQNRPYLAVVAGMRNLASRSALRGSYDEDSIHALLVCAGRSAGETMAKTDIMGEIASHRMNTRGIDQVVRRFRKWTQNTSSPLRAGRRTGESFNAAGFRVCLAASPLTIKQ